VRPCRASAPAFSASHPPPQEDRATLRDQLSAAPAEGDPAEVALSIARLRDLEARLLAEHEEAAAMAAEKQALQVGGAGAAGRGRGAAVPAACEWAHLCFRR
jgi:hypothetical protein